MKKTNTILTLMALSAAAAFAGVEPAPAPSGKGAVTPAPVDPCAVPISYNNVELLYSNTDAGPGSGDEDGLQLNFEYSPWNNIYFTGGVTYNDADGGETWTLSGGIGGYLPLTDNIHLAGDAGITYWDSDYNYVYVNPLPGGGGEVPQYYSDGDSETGWYVRPHIRAKWGCFEAHAGVMYVDLDEADDWTWFLQAFYQVSPGWDITVGYSEWDDQDADTWLAGVRYKF
jgi:hypothetical protein